ncbi:peptide-methionine (S)-S-oxide reductase [Gallaecimonas sp. GXIMD4217]|uniref:peptide-methionine (S)-S-oxide reductase n=1 Tax=Gallaecimonas sp. GXIMD4217 TaxID=3131927 RepID=UPI00311AEE9B
MGLSHVGLGGGCHWCTEAVFQALDGVAEVQQGHAAAAAPFDAFSEAVLVHFDERRLPLAVLIEVHLRTHACTSDHGLRQRYRSAIYSVDSGQEERARQLLAALARGFPAPLVTQVLPLVAFRPSPPKYQGYYRQDPDRPFCRSYIEPKLQLLLKAFGAFTRQK